MLYSHQAFSVTFAELATSTKSSLKYWRSELVNSLSASDKFCTKLICRYSQHMEIGELLGDALLQHLQTQQPEKLEFNIPNQVACPALLPQLLRKVQQHHEGELSLDLPYSYLNYVPCDDIIRVLAGAR